MSARDYLEQNGIETALAAAVAEVIKKRPDNPLKVISEILGMGRKFDAATPFLAIVRIPVKADQKEEYLKIAQNVDAVVETSEPGMLHHTFDCDPKNPNTLVWSEVYQNDAAFLAHLQNAPVGAYLGQHVPLADAFNLEIYGTVADETAQAIGAAAGGLPGATTKFFKSTLGFSRILGQKITTRPQAHGPESPFMVIARVTVKPGKISEYLAIAKEVDDGVFATEPGMIHHTFDQDPDDPHKFTWTEAYQNDAAMLAHLVNPVVGSYLSKHGAIADHFALELYGTVGDDLREALNSAGPPITYFDTACGFSRLW